MRAEPKAVALWCLILLIKKHTIMSKAISGSNLWLDAVTMEIGGMLKPNSGIGFCGSRPQRLERLLNLRPLLQQLLFFFL